MSTYHHRDYGIKITPLGEAVAVVTFTAEELRGIAEALGDHDGGSIELRAIADALDDDDSEAPR